MDQFVRRGGTITFTGGSAGTPGSDPEKDRAFYDGLRRKLITYFRHRKHPDPEDAADEVIARALARLCDGAQLTVPFEHFCFGIAQYVAKEAARRANRFLQIDERTLDVISPLEQSEVLRYSEILCEQILETLPEPDRLLLKKYYGDEDATRPGKLRTRAFRIIKKLRGKFGGKELRSGKTDKNRSAKHEKNKE